MANFASGKRRFTAWAIRCEAECQNTSFPSGESKVMTRSAASRSRTREQIGGSAVNRHRQRSLLEARAYGADRFVRGPPFRHLQGR